MKRFLALLIVGTVLLSSTMPSLANAANSGLLVLVDPDHPEVAMLEDLGHRPVGSMQDLMRQFNPAMCAVGISRSGHALADWDWIVDQMFDAPALVVGFGWDVGELVEYGAETEPIWIPGLISVLYMQGDEPVYFPVESAEELNWLLSEACLLLDAEPFDDFDFDFGFDPTDLPLDLGIEAMMDMILAEAQPYLPYLNQFLQPEWEYKVVTLSTTELNDDTMLAEGLDTLGAEGWELISMDGTRLVLKRRALDAERLIELILLMSMDMADLMEFSPDVF